MPVPDLVPVPVPVPVPIPITVPVPVPEPDSAPEPSPPFDPPASPVGQYEAALAGTENADCSGCVPPFCEFDRSMVT